MPDALRDEVAVISVPIEEPFPGEPDIDPDIEAAWQAQSTSTGSASSIEVDESQLVPPPPPSDETTPDEADDSNILDPRYKQDFEGLTYLGYLADEFDLAGHRFNVRTLNTDALLEVALWTQKYSGSLGESRAYSTAVVAAAVELIDGRPINRPLGPNEPDFALRVAVVRRWYPWTIDQIYSRVRELERRVDDVLSELGKASG
jgi:hypothetical protein